MENGDLKRKPMFYVGILIEVDQILWQTNQSFSCENENLRT
jgi:hypothetical protein